MVGTFNARTWTNSDSPSRLFSWVIFSSLQTSRASLLQVCLKNALGAVADKKNLMLSPSE